MVRPGGHTVARTTPLPASSAPKYIANMPASLHGFATVASLKQAQIQTRDGATSTTRAARAASALVEYLSRALILDRLLKNALSDTGACGEPLPRNAGRHDHIKSRVRAGPYESEIGSEADCVCKWREPVEEARTHTRNMLRI